MASYIDWYLIELEGRLAGRLPAERVFMVTSETEDHLRQKTADLVTAGMPEANAERTATNSFGTPARIAFELIEGLGSARTAAAGRWIIGLAAAVTFGTTLVCAATGNQPDVGLILGTSLEVGIPLALIGSLMSRKSMSKTILLAAMPTAIVTGLLMPLGHILQEGSIPVTRRRAGIQEEIRKMDADSMTASINAISDASAAYARLDKDPRKAATAIQLAPHTTAGRFVVAPDVRNWFGGVEQLGVQAKRPDRPYGYGYGYDNGAGVRYFEPPHYSSGTTTDLGFAEASWKTNGPLLTEEAQRRLARDNADLADIETQLHRSPSFSAVLFFGGALTLVFSALVLAAVTWGGVAVARAWRWGRVRRPVRA